MHRFLHQGVLKRARELWHVLGYHDTLKVTLIPRGVAVSSAGHTLIPFLCIALAIYHSAMAFYFLVREQKFVDVLGYY